jgi:hypothetical protein
MRKQEMSLRQLQERTLIVENLLNNGWQVTSYENEWFENGLSVQCEAVMEYVVPEVSLGVFYRADQNSLYLSLNMPDESSVELKMDVDDQLKDLLQVIISNQNKITASNFKEHIRSLMAVCKNIYVMNKEEKFVRLTNIKSA